MSEQGSAGRARPSKAIDQALAERAPWRPITCPAEVVGALQALNRGQAEPHQQKIALNWIIDMSRNGGAHYFPGEGGRRDTDYALGRAFPGEQIITLLNVKLRRENG